MNPQLKKGLLEYSILAALKTGDSYGYEIIKNLDTIIDISESTLYPILKRLERQEKITSYSEIYNNRLRKYYHITAIGETDLTDFLKQWQAVEHVYNFIKEVTTNHESD
ncbi:PadR family transcriptional regulator [Agrilactobacillus fermenti]|uniref:PadR family transcriptional regulator n=1 Tax=Agrilactobacillus fermenti TaxID=2586909 RepID=UPI001E2C3C1B|nr:PadR family transcriptional regulator [Agrilactobacillus fermenti]MCD2256704.1 PadR family transcriptional regulator [Agrilactobacillus fermenti]